MLMLENNRACESVFDLDFQALFFDFFAVFTAQSRFTDGEKLGAQPFLRCDFNNFNSWIATPVNQAGSYRLTKGSRIVGGLQADEVDLGVTHEAIDVEAGREDRKSVV